MKIDFLKIKANSPQRNSHRGFDSYVKSMEALVKETISESTVEIHETSHFFPIDFIFEKLNRSLPIVQISDEIETPCILSLRVLTRQQYSEGMRLFLCRIIEEKFLPTKKIEISFFRSLTFKFIVKPKDSYYIIEVFINVESPQDLQAIKKNFPRFEEEIRLTTLGVEHARKLILARGHSLAEKQMILLENFSSLVKNTSDFDRTTLFDDVQKLLLKGMYKKYPDKIPDHLLPFIDSKPQLSDHHIFNEIDNFSTLFHEDFLRKRSLSHLSKIISYLYLFQKIITYSIETKPGARHLSFKMIQLTMNETPILAVFLGVNLTQEHESLEELYLIEAIQKFSPSAKLVPGSNNLNTRSKKQVSTLYLEVQKEDGTPFETEIVKLMKKKIPKEICQSLLKTKEKPPSRIDETTRNILTLTKQIKTIHDPTKIIIQYNNQNQSHIDFTVILARLQKPEDPPLSLLSSPLITLRNVEHKIVGILKNRYVKEVYLYDLLIQKEGRNLKEARDEVLTYFKSRLHNLYDFNRGTVTRKYENLALFKSLIDTPLSTPILENYFYSITPSFMQALSSAETLKDHFHLILKGLDHRSFDDDPLFLIEEKEDQALIACCSTDESFIDALRKKGNRFSKGSTSTYLKVFDLHILGYITQKNSPIRDLVSSFKEEKLGV